MARMHRVVQEVIQQRMIEGERTERWKKLVAFVESLAAANWDDHRRYADLQELKAIEQFVRMNALSGDRSIGLTALWTVQNMQHLGRLRSARQMAELAKRILSSVLQADPDSAEKQRDLSISFERLGDVSVASGDLKAARVF